MTVLLDEANYLQHKVFEWCTWTLKALVGEPVEQRSCIRIRLNFDVFGALGRCFNALWRTFSKIALQRIRALNQRPKPVRENNLTHRSDRKSSAWENCVVKTYFEQTKPLVELRVDAWFSLVRWVCA